MTDQQPWATRTTTDRDEIREWADRRDADPAHVVGTGDGDDLGVLRFDLAEDDTDENLEPVAWDDFFGKFESANLAFRYQDETRAGGPSNFNRFVRRADTGVEDAPDADVTTVAVATAPVPTADADTEAAAADGSEPAVAEDDADPAAMTAALVVDEIHEDASGYDHWNKNDEYLVFRNDGDEPLELTGWTVQNSTGNVYEFPDEFVLDPDRSVTVHTGSGRDTQRDLYWGSPLAIWQNTGDVLTVTDDAGRRVIRVSY